MQVPGENEGRIALQDHIVDRARDARLRHGPAIDSASIMRVLNDRRVVRYPTGVRFDAGPLEPGEFAWAMPLGERASDGFCLFVHPHFEHRPETWAMLLAYHIPSISYGDIATSEEAELFGATLLGMEIEAYYQALCALCDELVPGSFETTRAQEDRRP